MYCEQWQFPRGAVRKGEGAQACALREFAEETGLTVHAVHSACRAELHYMVVIRDYDIERTVIYYLAEIGPGEIRLGNENHGEARWSTADEAWEMLAETSPEQLPALDAALEYLSTN
jgi:8-oxo-dGTP pyrophosphatase MutT (NUDIX family)